MVSSWAPTSEAPAAARTAIKLENCILMFIESERLKIWCWFVGRFGFAGQFLFKRPAVFVKGTNGSRLQRFGSRKEGCKKEHKSLK